MTGFLQQPFFDAIEGARSVIIAGAGGGCDVLCGLSLYFGLRRAGKTVHLASLSFSSIAAIVDGRIGEDIVRVTADTPAHGAYFPEAYLAGWFRRVEREEVPIHCFLSCGVRRLLEVYRTLVGRLEADAVILVDGGTDSLMRGDEEGLGTPVEDLSSIAAVHRLDIAAKFLVSIGFNVDRHSGVLDADVLAAIAELNRRGGFLGAFGLHAGMPEVVKYRSAAEAVFAAMPRHESIVSRAILASLEGGFGNCLEGRGRAQRIDPLMGLCWCFSVDAVASRIRFLDRLRETSSHGEVLEVIQRYQEDS